MISLKDIKDWLKQFDIAEHYYMGKLDNKQDKSIGIYQRRTSDQPRMCIGEKSSYDIKPVSILMHWSNDADETEEILYADENFQVKEHPVKMSNVYGSETYDASLEQTGWDKTDFDASE